MANSKNLVVLFVSMLTAGSMHCWMGGINLPNFTTCKEAGVQYAQNHLKTIILAAAVPTYVAARHDVLGNLWRRYAPQAAQEKLSSATDTFNEQSTTAKVLEVGGAAAVAALIWYFWPQGKRTVPQMHPDAILLPGN